MRRRATSEPSPLRKLAGRVKLRVAAMTLRGPGRDCPCCGRSYRRFLKFKDRAGAQCPGCGSLERHRALVEVLDEVWGSEPPARLLHFAPEPAIAGRARELSGKYVTADLVEPADLKLDISDLNLPDESFDAVICSHVLEHVPDDRAAMRELLRILRPGGSAVVLVPINWELTETDEDPRITDPAERLRRFGQYDHVRTYGADFADRLRAAGFEVEVAAGKGTAREAIHLCRRP